MKINDDVLYTINLIAKKFRQFHKIFGAIFSYIYFELLVEIKQSNISVMITNEDRNGVNVNGEGVL